MITSIKPSPRRLSEANVLTVISPSKNLDFKTKLKSSKRSDPLFLDEAELLINDLRTLDSNEIMELMNINSELSELNVDRYQSWSRERRRAKSAIFAFRGSVYLGLGADAFSTADMRSAHRRLRILSGLYGVLRPSDLIHPYRLEMGLPFSNHRGSDLYEFWGTQVTQQLNDELKQHSKPVLINLASNEYFRVIDQANLNYPVINCSFLDNHNGNFRFMSFYGKRARGLLAKYIVQNRVETIKGLKAFNLEGYEYSKERSSKNELVYIRQSVPKQQD